MMRWLNQNRVKNRRQGNIVNVGVDMWAFAPVSMDELLGEAEVVPRADR